MRQFLVIISLLVLAPVMTSRSITAPIDAPDDRPTHDFGSVLQGTVLTHTFTVPSEAGTDRRIERVTLSDRGMRARFKALVAAGAPGAVTIEWDTRDVEGRATAQADVHWQDSTLPVVSLTLNVNVQALIEIRPFPAVFFSVFRGETAERVLTIRYQKDRPLAMQMLEANSPHFQARLGTIEPGRLFELRVRVPADSPVGRFMESVTLRTDDPTRPEVLVPINVLVKSDVYANPETVDFGDIDRTVLARKPSLVTLLTQTFLVKRKDGAFRITGVTCDLDSVQVRFTPSNESDIFQFDVVPRLEKLVPGALKGLIRIQTSDERFPELIVPINAVVR